VLPPGSPDLVSADPPPQTVTSPAPVLPPVSQPPGGGLDLAGLIGGLLGGRGGPSSITPEVTTSISALAQALQLDAQVIMQLFGEIRAAREDAQYWRHRAEKFEGLLELARKTT